MVWYLSILLNPKALDNVWKFNIEHYLNILKLLEKDYWFISIYCIWSIKITFANRLKSWVIVLILLMLLSAQGDLEIMWQRNFPKK